MFSYVEEDEELSSVGNLSRYERSLPFDHRAFVTRNVVGVNLHGVNFHFVFEVLTVWVLGVMWERKSFLLHICRTGSDEGILIPYATHRGCV